MIGLPLTVVWRHDPDGAGTVIGSWGEGPFEPGSRWPLDDRAVAEAQEEAG